MALITENAAGKCRTAIVLSQATLQQDMADELLRTRE
jgi:hypothetical protein